MNAVSIAVVGAGYWGPNIIRNAKALCETDLRWVCDRDVDRARRVVGEQSAIGVTPDLDEVLADESVEAVAIATPPATHAEIALRCIEAGRHLLVEKPLADSYEAGLRMVQAAQERGVVLHCDHTFCYTPAVQKIRDLVAGRRAGRAALLRLGPREPGARPAGGRRLLGPRAARHLDPRLHPRRRAASR